MKTRSIVSLVTVFLLTSICCGQEIQISVKGKPTKKLSGDLAFVSEYGGTLVGNTREGQAIVRIPAQAVAQAAAKKVRFTTVVPEKFNKINQLLISYKGGKKPSEQTLEKLKLKLIADYQKGQFLIVESQLLGVGAAQINPLVADATVVHIEPNYTVQLIEPVRGGPRVKAPNEIPAKTPNDPRFADLWGMQNIHAQKAWDKITDAQKIVVAVIDTGVDYEHEDLVGNMWKNPGEMPGNNTDDDGNGFVDDVHGWDFFSNDNDPKDEHDHGTHCSGTIAGIGNNNVGVVGVAWKTQIMALRFLGPFGGSTADAIKCIDYAADNGANIMSNSWGGGSFSQKLRDAIERAQNKGILFIAAAGNDRKDNDAEPHYPSSYDNENIVSVAAIAHIDDRAFFTHWGRESVDIGAPGVDILSSIRDNKYAKFNGTSMATPHVSGALALTWAANPGKDWKAIRDLVFENARPVADLKNLWGHDAKIQGGVLDISFLGKTPLPPANGSGKTVAQRPSQIVGLDFEKLTVQPAKKGELICAFGRITPDASPGRNTLTITGLPRGTRAISVWMTEFASPNNPHAGGAFFYTNSVQLYENGTKCRVIFNLDWSRSLPAAAQIMFCQP